MLLWLSGGRLQPSRRHVSSFFSHAFATLPPHSHPPGVEKEDVCGSERSELSSNVPCDVSAFHAMSQRSIRGLNVPFGVSTFHSGFRFSRQPSKTTGGGFFKGGGEEMEWNVYLSRLFYLSKSVLWLLARMAALFIPTTTFIIMLIINSHYIGKKYF